MNPFKAYDIRGSFPRDLDEKFAYGLGAALAEEFAPQRVIIGHDCRLSSPDLANALMSGLASKNCQVLSLGMGCTEEVYFAAQKYPFDLGVMITASHNPANENGFKIVKAGAIPVSGDSGLKNVEKRLNEFQGRGFAAVSMPGKCERLTDARKDFVAWLLDNSGMRTAKKSGLKIIADCGNGCAGLLLRELRDELPFELEIINGEPDGAFPNGLPNPLLPENRQATSREVLRSRADLGIAFDGDADRCFFYDHTGRFIEGYYLVGLLAAHLLARRPAEKIVHDPRLYWNTADLVKEAGGIPIRAKTGHAFIKERMRGENAIYGGEMSGHHYFRDFAYCDSGMLPWLLVASLLLESGQRLSDLVDERMRLYPCSGEINRKLRDSSAAIEKLRATYRSEALLEEDIDGLNMEFEDWRFSVRNSHTEPLVRLNVESRANPELMERKKRDILDILES